MQNQTKKSNETKRISTNKLYLYNYLITFFMYIVSAIFYYVLETNKDGVVLLSIIFLFCQTIEFCLIYLLYKYIFKISRFSRFFKILLVIMLFIGFINIASSLKYSPHYLLIMSVIITIISLTVQNLILTWNKKTNTE